MTPMNNASPPHPIPRPAYALLLALAAALAGATALGGCGDEFEPAWKVQRFRVLGVKLDPPEARPGDAVHVTMVHHDPAGRPVQVAWIFCPRIDPRASNPFACGGAAPLVGSEADYVIPREGELGLDAQGRARIQGLAYACAGGALGFDRATGPTCAGGEGWLVTRSIAVSRDAATAPNRNPAITAVRFGAGPAASRVALDPENPPRVPRCTTNPCTSYGFEVVVAGDAREAYAGFGSDGRPATRRERVQFGFFTTAGALDGTFRVDTEARPEGPIENTWTPPSTPGTVSLWFTAQDPRGGMDFARRTVVVE